MLLPRTILPARYESPQHIMEEFYAIRTEYYIRRKTALLNKMQSEWSKLDNKVGDTDISCAAIVTKYLFE